MARILKWSAVVAGLAVFAVLFFFAEQERRARIEARGSVARERPLVHKSAAAIRGRVVTRGTGAPIERAQVIVDERHVIESDRRGEFEAPKQDGATQATFRLYHPEHGAWRTIRELSGEVLVFEMEPGLRVAGRIVTEGNHPVPGVLVTAGESQVFTDDEGRFVTGGHKAGPVEVSCWNAEAVAEAGGDEVTLVVAGNFLFVRACDEEGRPVRGVRYGVPLAAGGEGWSDYALIECEPGEPIRLELTKRGFLPARLDWVPKSRAPGVVHEVVVMRRRPANSLGIELRNADGSIPRLAHFRLIGEGDLRLVQESVTLQKGKGRVRGVPEGTYLAYAHADRDYALGVRAGVTIQSGDDNAVRFDLLPGARPRVKWTKYASKYRLELRSEIDPERRFWFGQYPGRALWGTTTRVPLGRYRLVEIRARDVLRECAVDLSTEVAETIDWSE